MNERQLQSDILYVCALIEDVARRTKNRPHNIAKIIGVEGIKWQLKYAHLSHCLTFDETSSEVIEAYDIPNGVFDCTANVNGAVPLPIHVARTYKSLVMNIAAADNTPIEQIIYDVFTSFISDAISNYKTSTFFENSSFIYHSYLQGELFND